ncbi:MAG: hypothetical protein ACFFCM_01525 [Promethearchaeota archaeon]
MSQINSKDESQGQNIKDSKDYGDIPTKTLAHLTIVMFLLIFGTLLAVFSSYITQTFADAYQFMNGLRNIFNSLLNNMLSYYVTLTEELTLESLINFYTKLATNLYHIMVFNFLYTQTLLVSNPSLLTMLFNLPPNPAIPDVILGYSLIIYCTLNLIQIIQKIVPKTYNPYLLQILFAIFGICGGVIILGIMFLNIVIIAISILIIIICFTYIGLWLPTK